MYIHISSLDVYFLSFVIVYFILAEVTKNLMFPKILFISLFAFKALLGNM